MESHGLRYGARALHRQTAGSWKDFRCVLVAPQRYLESAYPLNDFEAAGWHKLIALEDVSKVLKRTHDGMNDSRLIDEAVLPSNSWNKPIPEAVQFWRDVSRMQRALYPTVPFFDSSQQGARLNVWPSFYENQLASNRNNPRRKRVQIVLSSFSHVALFIKNVRYVEFEAAVRPLLTTTIKIGAPRTAWQSVRILVPELDPLGTVEGQLDALDCVFKAAQELYEFFLESVRTLQAGLQSFLSMRRIEARRKNAKAFRLRHSQSLARRRQRLSHAMVRSTIQRFGKTTNSLTPSERLTISMSRCGRTFCNCFRKFRPFISAVDEQRLQKWKHAEQCRHDESAAIAILDIGRMNNGVEQQAYCVDKNVPLLALDLLARIVPVRINARPPFSALFTLWLSMMAAVGLAFRCARSRHRS